MLITVVTLPLFLSSYFFFLKVPPIWPDEGTSLYQAKTLLETGKMQAYNYGGVPEVAKSAGLGFPPLYFALLGLWTGTFGESIESIRALSLSLGVLCVVVFYFLVPRILLNKGVIAFWGALLLSFNLHFAQASRWGRPEILTLLFILLTLYFWFIRSRQVTRSKPKTPRGWALTPPGWTLLGSAVFASLAVATHPMGFLAPIILGLAILLSHNTLKTKFLSLLGLGITLATATAAWILITQKSVSSFWEALRLGSEAKLGEGLNLMNFGSNWIWTSIIIVQLLVVLVLFYKKYNLFIPLAATISLVWVSLNREGYYTVYAQPFLILAALSLIHLLPRLKWGLIGFLIFSDLYLQFGKIDYYTPPLAFWQLSSFNYHELTAEIEKYITPGVDGRKTTLFLASIPDPYLDLRLNSHYRLYQAIDPNYPVDEEDYKKTLDSTDFVIFTWFPHDYLAYYVQTNAEKITTVTGGGYGVNVARLKERDQRN